MNDRSYYVYILANSNNRVLYTGITCDLERRIWEHKTRHIRGFTARYNVDRLVYYETFNDAVEAIQREKQITAGKRKAKIMLIKAANPEWTDLAEGMGIK